MRRDDRAQGSRRIGSDSPRRRQTPTERYVADRKLKSLKEQLEDEERAAKALAREESAAAASEARLHESTQVSIFRDRNRSRG